MRYVTLAVVTNMLPRSRESRVHLKMTTIFLAPHVMLNGPSLTSEKSFFGHSLMTQIPGLAEISQLVTKF